MNTETGRKHYMDVLAVFAVFAVFAACVTAVLLSGAGIYKRLNSRDTEAFYRRTAQQYITTKVRSVGSAENLSVVPFGDGEALCISGEIEGSQYNTYVYASTGWMREMFVSNADRSDPDLGEEVLQLKSIGFSLENGLLKVVLELPEQEPFAFCINVDGEQRT